MEWILTCRSKCSNRRWTKFAGNEDLVNQVLEITLEDGEEFHILRYRLSTGVVEMSLGGCEGKGFLLKMDVALMQWKAAVWV
jgi:hypothetical protein